MNVLFLDRRGRSHDDEQLDDDDGLLPRDETQHYDDVHSKDVWY
jgi:hypothetical protein